MTSLVVKLFRNAIARIALVSAIILVSCGGPLVPFYIDYSDVPRDGLIGEWTFDYGLLDTSDTRAKVTKEYGSKSYSRLPERSSYFFDGSDTATGALTYSDKYKFNGTTKYSLSFWVLTNVPTYPDWCETVNIGGTLSPHFKATIALANSPDKFYASQQNPGFSESSFYRIKPPTSQWTHVVIVSDGVNFSFYQDNVFLQSATVFIAPQISTGEIEFSHSNKFPMYVDDVRLYDRVLSTSEIDALYHEGGYGN